MPETQEKKYVVITNAQRAHISCDGHIGTRTAKKVFSQYRHGDLALLHPAITQFFDNWGEGPKHYSFKRISGSEFMPYTHEKEDIPLLLYRGNLLHGGESFSDFDEKGYFISIMRKGEFEPITGRDFKTVTNEIDKVYSAQNTILQTSVYPYSQRQTLEKAVDEQFRHLEAFDILFKDKISDITLELASFDISEKQVQNHLGWLKGMDAIHIKRMQPLPHLMLD